MWSELAILSASLFQWLSCKMNKNYKNDQKIFLWNQPQRLTNKSKAGEVIKCSLSFMNSLWTSHFLLVKPIFESNLRLNLKYRCMKKAFNSLKENLQHVKFGWMFARFTSYQSFNLVTDLQVVFKGWNDRIQKERFPVYTEIKCLLLSMSNAV